MKRLLPVIILSLIVAGSVTAQVETNVEQAVRFRVVQEVPTIQGNAPADLTENDVDLTSQAMLNKSNSQIEDLGSRFKFTRSNSQIEDLGSRFKFTRSNSQLEDLGSRYGWAGGSNSQLEQLGSDSRYGWAGGSNSQLEQLGSRYITAW